MANEKRRIVYIAHPLGQGEETRVANRQKASAWAAWCAGEGNAPVADWVILAGQWDESRREEGLDVDKALIGACDELWLCGPEITAGMTVELGEAQRLGKVVVDLTGSLQPPNSGSIAEDRARHRIAVERAKGATRTRGSGEGIKYDSGKLRYDLVDGVAYADLVRVITFGAAKYAPNNWRKLDEWRGRYFAACIRHLEAWRAGVEVDPDSGLRHLAHAACNVHFLQALDAAANAEEDSDDNIDA